MVRAGERGYLAEDFARANCVAVGFTELGDASSIQSQADARALVDSAYPGLKPVPRSIAAGTLFKFRSVMSVGDKVVTYDPSKREYLFGTVSGEYEFSPNRVPAYNHIRNTVWIGRISRDALKPSSRNSLGSLVTMFAPGEDVLADLEAQLALTPNPTTPGDIREPTAPSTELSEELEVIRRDMTDRAQEFLKDKIRSLSPDDLEELTASLLRALGYKARVTPKGADRGRDVVASPDGLGLQPPRIVGEVKHRPREPMGAPQIRSFIGGLREGDRGLYVSTGGFTREARYEADRASIPISLVDLDDLASLVSENYESFDADGRALVPLIKIYWPAS